MRGLQIENIVKTFGRHRALDDVSLEIPGGKLVCFLGPSGCGKTTLLRIIAGLEQPTAGTVRYAGRDITAEPAHRRRFGMVFQSLALFPHLTVAGNIGYAMRIAGRDRRRRDERVAELLDLIQLPGIGDRNVAQLSGGQRQRVAIARALAQEPPLFLLDEPMSALDAKLREDLQVELRLLQRRLKITTVLVTHDQKEAMTLSDIVVVMRDGRIEQMGLPTEVYSDPASLFVADFIGRSNLLAGEARNGAVIVDGEVISGTALPVGSDGGAVTLAIRPENLRLHPDGTALPNSIRARVQFIRNVGSMVEAHVNGGAVHMVSCCPPRDWPGFAEGEQVVAELPSDCCKVFAGHA